MQKSTLDSFLKLKRKNSPKKNENERLSVSPEPTSQKKQTTIIPTSPVVSSSLSNSPFYSTYNDFIAQLQTWQSILSSFISPPNNKTMVSIYKFVKTEYETKTIFPPKQQLFTAFQLTPFNLVKVVILGQDPYPTPGDAMGLSFSVPKGQRIPKSLDNIYKCLSKDDKIKFTYPKHGDLTNWAKQGIFLLNSTLTVESRKPNSHQKKSQWSSFSDFVINQISKEKEHIVFLLWGNFAHEKKKLINQNKHLIIETIHPSPLASKKGDFTLSKQFSETNEYLKKHGLSEIDWQV